MRLLNRESLVNEQLTIGIKDEDVDGAVPESSAVNRRPGRLPDNSGPGIYDIKDFIGRYRKRKGPRLLGGLPVSLILN